MKLIWVIELGWNKVVDRREEVEVRTRSRGGERAFLKPSRRVKTRQHNTPYYFAHTLILSYYCPFAFFWSNYSFLGALIDSKPSLSWFPILLAPLPFSSFVKRF
jgi:hypothetical protein